jgi:ribulose-phosphate 3-epimerase
MGVRGFRDAASPSCPVWSGGADTRSGDGIWENDKPGADAALMKPGLESQGRAFGSIPEDTVSESEKIIIEPSILSADYARFGEEIRETAAAGAEAVQIDIMDGHFVPNLTFGPGIVRALRPLVSLTLDVHLMIDNPDSFLEAFARAGADRLIVHQEVCPNLDRTLQAIHALGVQAGIAVNPATSVCVLTEVLALADVIQVMTVHPGFGGQEFLHSQLEKIRGLRGLLRERGLPARIAVDGGIDRETAPLAAAAGATVLVAGSAVYNRHGSVAGNIAGLQAAVREHTSA